MTNKVKPADFPWMVPYLVVQDSDRALDFYAQAFGFAKKFALPGPDGKTGHAEMTYRDTVVMFSPEGSNGCPVRCPASSGQAAPLSLYVYCDDVDALCRQAESAGATVDSRPTDMFWGDRICALVDPDGYKWCFATHTGKTFECKPALAGAAAE
jgi:uncharacterized glyoxalase superfamily protein PhnB